MKFDVTTDPHFLVCVRGFRPAIQSSLLSQMASIQANLSWDDFVKRYSWSPIVICPIDGFPGGSDFFSFLVTADAALIEIPATVYPPDTVVCAAARYR